MNIKEQTPLILITGGAGFIGSHTADLFRKKGYRIRILDNLMPPVHKRGEWPSYVQGKGYELVRGDVRSKKDIEKALHGVSYVYHLAAHQDQLPNFSTFFDVNTVSTALLYECIVAKQLAVQKIILSSSQFVYGDGVYHCTKNGGHVVFPELRDFEILRKGEWEIICPLHHKEMRYTSFRENQELTPTNSYGLSKVALEQCALRLGKTYHIPTVILRYSIVQGPRQSPRNIYSGALRIFVTQALLGEPITVYEDGYQRRDFVNVYDVAEANFLVLHDERANFKTFNVGGGKGYRVIDFAKMVQKIIHTASSIKKSGFRRTDTRYAISDIRALKRLGWKPRYAPEFSIQEYCAWIKNEGLQGELKRGTEKRLRGAGVVYDI